MIKKQAVIKTLSYDSNGIIFINFQAWFKRLASLAVAILNIISNNYPYLCAMHMTYQVLK